VSLLPVHPEGKRKGVASYTGARPDFSNSSQFCMRDQAVHEGIISIQDEKKKIMTQTVDDLDYKKTTLS
jgi:hypothetical protein